MRAESTNSQFTELIIAGILLFTIAFVSLLAVVHRFNVSSAALDARILRLESMTVEISLGEWEIINSNFKFIESIADEAKALASNAHERIEYYRDVLDVVARTAPTPKRVRLPVLPGGDPKAKQ